MLVWRVYFWDFRALLDRYCGFDDVYPIRLPGQEQPASKSGAFYLIRDSREKDFSVLKPFSARGRRGLRWFVNGLRIAPPRIPMPFLGFLR